MTRKLGKVQQRIIDYLTERQEQGEVELGMLGADSSSTFNALFALRDKGLIIRVDRPHERTIYGWWRLATEEEVAAAQTKAAKLRPLKVYAGRVFFQGGMAGGNPAVLAAPSQRRAAEILGMAVSSFRDWWSETGNKAACEAALNNPEQVMVADKEFPNTVDAYRPKPKR